MSEQGLNELAENLDIALSYTSRVLSQFAGAHVDAYTINYLRLMVKDVQISPTTSRAYNAALSNLPVFPSPDENLTFGYSLSLLVRNGGVHLFGYVHLVLCSAMGETFSEDYAAAVLADLGRPCEDLVGVSPHVHQYRGMVAAFNGVLSTSGFGIMVDDRVRLNPYTDSYQHCPITIALPPPGEVAAAIQMLFDISIGRRKKAILVGGDVLGWIAAYAQSELDLSVSIHDKDDNLLFSSHNGVTGAMNNEAQVKIVFAPAAGSEEDLLTKAFEGSLRLDSSIKSKQALARQPVLPFTGRVLWQSILPKVFGKTFHRLDHAESKMFGTFCGTTARVFQHLVEHHHDSKDPHILSPQNKQNPRSWGIGLLNTMFTWFPELRKFQGRAEKQLKNDWEEAGKLHLTLLDRLEEICGCEICDKTKKEPPLKGPADGFCIACLCETIITLSLSLSRITLGPGIYPSRSGILHIYQSQVAKRIEAKNFPSRGNEGFKIVHGNEWNADYSQRLANCAAVFSGIPPPVSDVHDWPGNLIAVSHEGICAYVLGLGKNEKFRCGPNSDNDVIRVTSGKIGWKWKTYRRVCYGPPRDNDGNDIDRIGWYRIKAEHLDLDLWCK